LKAISGTRLHDFPDLMRARGSIRFDKVSRLITGFSLAGRFGNFFSEKKLHTHLLSLNGNTRVLALVKMNKLIKISFLSEMQKLNHLQ